VPLCNDGNPCTADICDPQTAECSFPLRPRDFCTESDHARLLLVKESSAIKERRFKWTWTRRSDDGGAYQFDNATAYSNSYSLCIYAGTASSLVSLMPHVAFPSTWQRDPDAFGSRYKMASEDGSLRAHVDGNARGKTSIQILAKGTGFPSAALPIGAPTRPVTIQMHRGRHICWQSTFDDVREQGDTTLRARQ